MDDLTSGMPVIGDRVTNLKRGPEDRTQLHQTGIQSQGDSGDDVCAEEGTYEGTVLRREALSGTKPL